VLARKLSWLSRLHASLNSWEDYRSKELKQVFDLNEISILELIHAWKYIIIYECNTRI
jgi:hypothetical protein